MPSGTPRRPNFDALDATVWRQVTAAYLGGCKKETLVATVVLAGQAGAVAVGEASGARIQSEFDQQRVRMTSSGNKELT